MELPVHADTAVIVVHGIGEQIRGATLLEWVEPLCGQLDVLSRRNGGRGVVIESSMLTTDEPSQASASQVYLRVHTKPGESQLLRFTEARWSRAFLQIGYRQVLTWSASFTWVAAARVGRLLMLQAGGVVRNLRHTASAATGRGDLIWGEDDPERETTKSAAPPVPGNIGIVAGLVTTAYVLVALVMLALAVPAVAVIGVVAMAATSIGLLVLALLAGLPWIGSRVRPVVVALVTTVGDANAFVNYPVRAAAMRDVVRREILAATGVADRVIVIAHSQGAAISVQAILDPDGGVPVHTLITAGAGIMLLRPRAARSLTEIGPSFSPIAEWAARKELRWINFWATSDPVASGPVADSEAAVKRRWQECYSTDPTIQAEIRSEIVKELGPPPPPKPYLIPTGDPLDEPEDSSWQNAFFGSDKRTKRQAMYQAREAEISQRLTAEGFPRLFKKLASGPGAAGPVERAVLNRSSLLQDHSHYTRNVPQVIVPIARIILGGDIEESDMGPLARSERATWGTYVRELANSRIWTIILGLSLAPTVIGWLTNVGVLDTVVAQASSLNAWVPRAVEVARMYGAFPMIWLILVGAACAGLLSVLGAILWSIPLGSIRKARPHPYWAALPFRIFRAVIIAGAFGLFGVPAWAFQDGDLDALALFVVLVLFILLYGAVFYTPSPDLAPARLREVSAPGKSRTAIANKRRRRSNAQTSEPHGPGRGEPGPS